MRDALAQAQFAPIVTADPGEIERIVKAERPRLVLLDLMLPDTDGIELMRTVPALAELPVIFISGYGRDETVARALEAGADDYIVKPFSSTELAARVRDRHTENHDPPQPVNDAVVVTPNCRPFARTATPIPSSQGSNALVHLFPGRTPAVRTLVRLGQRGEDRRIPTRRCRSTPRQ